MATIAGSLFDANLQFQNKIEPFWFQNNYKYRGNYLLCFCEIMLQISCVVAATMLQSRLQETKKMKCCVEKK